MSRSGALVLRLAGFGVIALLIGLRTVSSIPRELTGLDVYFHSLSALGFALILASTVLGPRQSPWTRWLSHRSLQFLGVVSYSLYIWHEPILIELGNRQWLLSVNPEAFPINAVILGALSIAAGALSYQVLERPTMELRHLFGPDGRLAQRYGQNQLTQAEKRHR